MKFEDVKPGMKVKVVLQFLDSEFVGDPWVKEMGRYVGPIYTIKYIHYEYGVTFHEDSSGYYFPWQVLESVIEPVEKTYKVKRRGIFYVSKEMMDNVYEILYKLKFIPYAVKFDFEKNSFRFFGESPYFDEVKEGRIVPEYNIKFHKTYFNFNGESPDFQTTVSIIKK